MLELFCEFNSVSVFLRAVVTTNPKMNKMISALTFSHNPILIISVKLARLFENQTTSPINSIIYWIVYVGVYRTSFEVKTIRL